jgi:hypothetical protein
MKGILPNRNDVVPLRERRDVAPTLEPPLAAQLGEMRLLNEKLLYRIQQLERREKSTRNLLKSLTRQVNALKNNAQPVRSVPPTPQVSEDEPQSEPPEAPAVATPTRTVQPLSTPEFGRGAAELNNRRR